LLGLSSFIVRARSPRSMVVSRYLSLIAPIARAREVCQGRADGRHGRSPKGLHVEAFTHCTTHPYSEEKQHCACGWEGGRDSLALPQHVF
jgi:hypothetical protein